VTRSIACAAFALALAACTRPNLSSVELLGRAAPQDTTQCQFDANGDRLLGTGILDVGSAYAGVGHYLEYGMAVYIRNNLVDPAVTSSAALTDSKTWRALSAHVRVNPPSFIDTFGANPGVLAPACGTCDQFISLDGTGIQPNNQEVVSLRAISQSLGSQLRTALPANSKARVVLGITVEGVTTDGETLDSGEWYYGVDVCDGCLPIPTCPAGQVLSAANCIGFGQDNSPVCLSQ
jgi:hypothetical protein